MAINKKLIHFEKFQNFNSKKLSANKENTAYTVGIDNVIQTGNPEILYQSIVYIKDIQQQWTHGKLYNGNEVLINITHQQLLELRDAENLIPGCLYRITDYVTTTTQENTKAANNRFDIIITALTNNTISENAKACLNDNDTYFENNDLNAWEIKYCVDNDTSRFSWADTTNGKGVIYYIKDEYNNEACYDFKNIQFLRTADFFNTNSFLPHLEGDNYYFTFSNIVNNEIIDSTVYNENITISIQNKIDKINGTKYSLNNTIFINDSSGYTRYNTIGFGNNNNTFGSKSQANTILQHCYNNVIGTMFRNNVIDQYFCNNKVSGQFEYNKLGIQCFNNNFSGHIWFTTFGSQFNYCSFNIPEGSNLEYCEFGSGIGFLNGIPAIRKVKFENNVAWYDSTTYVSNLQTIDGITLAEAITVEHDDQLYVYKVGDKYGVTSLHNIKKDINDNILIPIYSKPNLDFNDTGNNINCYGYVGTLQNIKVNGDLILIDSIGVYVREGNASPNLGTPVWCRVLKFVNGTWEIVYQSIESKTIGDSAPETLFSFKMKAVNEQNKLIKSTDRIAIVYVNAEDAPVISSTQLGFKSINVQGGLSNPITAVSTGVPNWAPAFVVGYLSMADTPVTIPTKTSDLTNDSGFITINDVPALEIPDEYVTETELNDKGFLTEHQDISGKQDKLHSYIEQRENDQVISAAIGINKENDILAIGVDSNAKEAMIGVSDSTNLSLIKTTSTSIVVESGLAGADNPGLHVNTQSARIQSENGTAVVSVNNSGVMSINADELSVNIPVVNVSDNVFVSAQTENSASTLSMINNGETILSTTNNRKISEIRLDSGEFTINSSDYVSINTNELILPELSKVKFGEQTLSTSGAYSLVNHELSDTTFTLTPNTFHVWGEVTTLDLDLGTETEGVSNEYLFQFTSGSTATSLSLPDSIKWTNEPNIGTNKIYQISILNGLGSILEFSV